MLPPTGGVIWNGINFETPVIPAKAGIQCVGSLLAKICGVDSRFRGNDCDFERRCAANTTSTPHAADLRAPTPSAAAELVVHRKQDFITELENRARRMAQIIRLQLSEARQRLTELRMHHAFQTLATRLAERAQRVDDAVASLERSMRSRLNMARQEWLRASAGVVRYDFQRLLALRRASLEDRVGRFDAEFRRLLTERRNRLAQVEAVLKERSPLTILQRGYSITRDAAGKIIRDAEAAVLGSDVSVRLAHGELAAVIKDRKL